MRAYKANMIPGGVTPTINVSQYDNDYAVTVTLIEGTEIYTPPVGATIRVEGTKPDGHGFEYPCTYQGNVVTMPIYTQMTVVSGRFLIELVVYQSGLRVGSCNIIFAVEKAPLGEDTDISETVIPDIIDAAQASAEAAEAWAVGQRDGVDVPSTDETYHNNAKYYAQAAAASAATATAEQQSASASATAAAGSASQAANSAQSANLSAIDADAAKTAAQTAAAQASTDANTASDAASSATSSAATATAAQQSASASATTATNAETNALAYRDAAAVSAASAETAKDAAMDAAQAAAQSAASLTVDTELSSTSTNPVQNKVIDATVTELKNELTEFDNGITNAFADRSTWYNCYFNASGQPITNGNNVSPTNAPFLLEAGKQLYVAPNGLTGNLFIYSYNDGVYSRTTVKTFSQQTTLQFTTDTYITLHFGGTNLDKYTAPCTIKQNTGVEERINFVKYVDTTIENNFSPAGDYKQYYFKLGRLSGETISVAKIPNIPNIRYAIRGFSDSQYVNRVYNSDWQTVPFSTDINEALYYDVYVSTSNNSQILDFDAINDFEVVVRRETTSLAQSNTLVVDGVTNYGILENATVKTIGHRGDPINAPECTAPAYITAKKHGISIAENDIFKTADGVYMCWHDDTLSKCGNLLDINGYLMYTDGTDFYYYNPIDAKLYTWSGSAYVESAVSVGSLTRCAGGNYAVAQMNSTLLKRIDVGVYKGTKFAGTQMLTFAEWVLLCKKLGMEMYLDTKVSHTQETIDDWLEILDAYGMRNYASWLSVFVPLTAHLKEADPNARIGFLTAPTQELVEAYTIYNTGRGIFFNPAIADVTSEKVILGTQAGFDVECWYANGTTAEATVFSTVNAAIANGVSGVTMDHYKVEDVYADLLN